MLPIYKEMLHGFESLDATVILFGSAATGKSRIDSDVDIAIITDDESVKEKARKIADSILFEYGKLVSLISFSEGEFEAKIKYPFVQEILKGVVLNDRRKLVKRTG